VERWFGHLDNKAIRRGVFLSVVDLQASIAAFLKAWNDDPHPFVWTATVASIQKNSIVVGRLWSESSPAVPAPSPESGSAECLVI
jgi:hypothetical protein